MSKRRYAIFFAFLSIGIILWQLPSLLKMIPSRYVAAYLPQSLQPLAEREHVEILPAATGSIDVSSLLDDDGVTPSSLEPTSSQSLPPPVTTRTTLDVSPQVTSTALADTVDPAEKPIEDEAVQVEVTQPTPTVEPIPVSYRLGNFRHEFQGWNNCGPATLSMALSYFGISTNQQQTASILKPNPEDRNVSPYEMSAYVNEQTDLQAINRVNGSLDTLKRLLAKGIPVVIELGLDPPGEYRWMGWYGHYLLLVAYDDNLQQVWVYDSWFGTSEIPGENADREGRVIGYQALDNYWRQFNRSFIAIFRSVEREIVEAIVDSAQDDSSMWQGALDRTRQELEESPDNAFLWFNLGTSYSALGEYEKAAAAFDQARGLGLPWRMLWYQFGPFEAYYQVGRYEDVVLLADITLKDRPYFEESYYYKGLALSAMGNQDEAIRNFERAVNFNPNYNPASVQLQNLAGSPE